MVRVYPSVEPPTTGMLSGDYSGFQGGQRSAAQAAPWYADLLMQAGQLQSCAVFNAAGERWLVGEQALDFLRQIGRLSYELLPAPASPGFAPSGGEARPPSYQSPAPAGFPSPRGESVPEQPGEATRFPVRPGSFAASWRPSRTNWGDAAARNGQLVTRDQRRALALVNGQRSVEELARLLGYTPQALFELLTTLREQQFIS